MALYVGFSINQDPYRRPKKSEALRASQASEFRKYLEQLNASQGHILNRLRTLPVSPAGDDTWVKRLASLGDLRNPNFEISQCGSTIVLTLYDW